MAREKGQNTLLESLIRLYDRMAQQAMALRRGIGQSWRARHHETDITSPLQYYIDKIAESAVSPSTPAAEASPTSTEPARTRIKEDGDQPSARSGSPLESYLDHRKAASILAPELGHRLEQSIWHHLHEAIRLSRAGDKKNAAMHAHLADHALEEAVQYMKREDFARLIDQIKTKFDEILAELNG